MRRVNVITYYVVFLLFIIVSVSVFAQERRPARRLQERAKPEVLYLTPEQEAEVLEYIREAYPERAKNLELWKDLRPEQYRKGLSRAFREMRFMEALKEKDPDRYGRVAEEKRLERESRQLAQQYRKTEDEAEKTRLKGELQSLLYELFDYRQMNRKDEIERLEKRLAELREANQERLASKEEIVQRRLDALLGEKGMEW